MRNFLKKIRDICQMIKIEHSIFALPWAWAGTFLAERGLPSLGVFLWLTVAMVAVRSFAMTFNRIADLKYDRENARTSGRPLVTGAISLPFAWGFCLAAALIFIGACAMLNNTCLALSVPALLFAGAYSLTKRLSFICHFWLGATLGLAPLAGWLSVDPHYLALSAVMLFFAITFWVGAFDIYYAFQDLDFDSLWRLHSVPADFGPETALAIAAFSHVMTVIFLFLTGLAAALSWPWYVLCTAIALLLYYEHRLMKPDDLSRVGMAFFTLNGIISPLALAGIILGMFV